MAKNTREKLIAAGRDLFSSCGYENTSVGDLENAVGLTPRAGGFYRHFKSKEDLLLELAGALIETPDRLGLDTVLPLEDTKAELIYIARSYWNLNSPEDGIADIIHAEAIRVPALKALIDRANDLLFDALRTWLKSKPLAGELSESQISDHVFIVFGGWLFFLNAGARLSNGDMPGAESLLKTWAAHWAPILDGQT